ncbi:MAG: cation diffusion facilitator family transporter [Tetrasphaera sp.]
MSAGCAESPASSAGVGGPGRRAAGGHDLASVAAHEHGHGGHAHSGSHVHSHAISADASRPYLWGAVALLSAFTAGEAVAALVTNSLALLTDAAHMLSDIAAIAAALFAMRIAARPAGGRMTFGWKRAEILSAAGNGATLLVVGGLLGLEAVHRLLEPPAVGGGAVLTVALFGVAVNLVATWLMSRANRTSLNVEGAYQHILTDLFAFIGTAIAGAVILLTGWMQADAIASLVVCALMLRSGWGLIRESGWILLEAAPADVNLDEIRDHLLEVHHVIGVHDLHVWRLTDSLPAVSVHIAVEDECFRSGHAADILIAVQECLSGHFDVEHSTFQIEPRELAAHDEVAH